MLVFVASKRESDLVAIMLGRLEMLVSKDIRTMSINKDRSPEERIRAIRDFNEGKTKVLVCTDVFKQPVGIIGLDHVSLNQTHLTLCFR